MSKLDPRWNPAAAQPSPPPPAAALPLRTIPGFAIPVGATSPAPPALTTQTVYRWSPPERPRYVWRRPGDDVAEPAPPAA